MTEEQILIKADLEQANCEGKLPFTKLKDAEDRLNQFEGYIHPVTQRRIKSKIILVKCPGKVRIFQIKHQEIVFVGEQVIKLPIKAKIKEFITSENHLLVSVPKSSIKKCKQNLSFFEENGLDWVVGSNLVFQCRYGGGQPDLLKAEFLGEMKNSYGGYHQWEILDTFEDQKPLFKSKLSVVTAISNDSYTQAVYFVELGSRHPNLAKKIFEVKQNFQEIQHFQEKLDNDKKRISEVLSCEMSFYENLFLFNWEPGRGNQHQISISVKDKMMAVQLIDLRLRKIAVRPFVSIYELFEGMGFIDYAESLSVDILKADYSPGLDTLVLEAEVEIEYLPEEDPDIYSFLQERIEAGLVNRRSLPRIHLIEDDDDFLECFRMNFVVSHLTSRARRTIEVIRSGIGASALVDKTEDKVVILTQDDENLQIKILSKSKKIEKMNKMSLFDNSLNQKSAKITIDGPEKLRKQLFTFKKSQLNLPPPPYEMDLKSCFVAEEGRLLVQDSKHLLLLDLYSNQLKSRWTYSNNLPMDIENLLIDDNLMLKIDKEMERIELFQVKKDQDTGAPFQFVSFLSLKNIEYFHSIQEMSRLKKTSANTLESILQLKIINPEEIALSTFFYHLTVKLSEDPKSGELSVESYYWLRCALSPDFVTEIVYYLDNAWNITTIGDEEMNASQLRSFHQKRVKIEFQVDPCDIDNWADLEFSFTRGDFLYLFFRREEEIKQIVKKVQYKKGPSEKMMVRSHLVRSIEIRDSTQYFLNSQTDDFYFLFFEMQVGEGLITVEVVDENFDKMSVFQIVSTPRGIDFFEILTSDTFQLVISPSTDEGNKNVIVNWRENTYKELVAESGEPLFSTPFVCGKNRLIAFSRDYEAYLNGESDGIYIFDGLFN